MKVKQTLLVGATLATVTLGGVGGLGLVSAATDNSSSDSSTSTSTDKSTGMSSLVDKIAAKFNLNKDEVKIVFDEDRTERQAEMKANQAEKLAQAVTDGKLTQEQADYITAAVAEIDALRGTDTPDSQDTTTRDQIKTKMDALRTWATDNDVDMRYVMGGGHGGMGGRGMGGPGGPRGGEAPDASSSSSSNSDSSEVETSST